MNVLFCGSKGDLSYPIILDPIITNDVAALAKLWDQGWMISDTSLLDNVNWIKNNDIGLVIVELGWKHRWQNDIREFKKHCPNVKVLCMVGALSRIVRSLDASRLKVYIDAIKCCDLVGVMNIDEIFFFKNLLDSENVYHIPVPINAEFYRKKAKHNFGQTSRGKVALSMHSDLYTGYEAKRCDLYTFALWKGITKLYPHLLGTTWVNINELRSYGSFTPEDLENTLRCIGINNVKVKPNSSDFYLECPTHFVIINLNDFQCQSRASMYGAAMGVPVIATDANETHRRIWPNLAFRPCEQNKAISAFQNLYHCNESYAAQVEYAQKQLEFYCPRNIKLITEAALTHACS